MWGYLSGVSLQRSPLLGPVPVRLPLAAGAGAMAISDDTLWTGAPGNYTDPNASAALAEVRELVDQGWFTDATVAATGLFVGQTKVYQPLGDINIVFGTSDQEYDSYRRQLDLHTTTTLVTYNIGGVQYTREHFCSNPHQVVVAAASSFDGPFVNPLDSKLNPTSLALNTLNLSKNLTFDQLKAAHLDDYQSLFYRVTLQLSRGLNDTCTLMTEKERLEEIGEAIRTSEGRVKSFSSDEDPSLVELLFQYGRYLLISCSRPGTQVSNLQGIRSQDTAPAWE